MNMERKLYRSRTNRMLGGVCGGLGEYLSLDPTVVRLLWVLFTFVGASGLLAYLICLLIIPENPVYEI